MLHPTLAHFTRFAVLLIVCLALRAPPPCLARIDESPGPLSQTDDAPWDHEPLDAAALHRRIQEVQRLTDAGMQHAGDPTPESAGIDPQQIPILERQINLLTELIGIVTQQQAVSAQVAALPRIEREIVESREQVFAAPPKTPEPPTQPGLEKLNDALKETRKQLAALRESTRQTINRMDQLSSERQTFRERIQSASRAILSLSQPEMNADDPARGNLVMRQVENARIEKRIGEEGLALLKAEEAAAEQSAPVRSRQIAHLEQLMLQQEDLYNQYQDALQQTLASRHSAEIQELERKERAAAQAVSPGERLIAAYEAQIARSTANLTELEARVAEVSHIEERLQKRLNRETARFEAVQTLVLSAGETGQTGQRLRAIFQRIRNSRTRLQLFQHSAFSEALERHRNRRFEIEETILSVEETWREELNAARDPLPEAQADDLEARVLSLRGELRAALLNESDLLSRVILSEENVDDLAYSFSTLTDEMEQFLLPRLFWIRDAQPLGRTILSDVRKDALVLMGWFQETMQLAAAESGGDLLPARLLLSFLLLAAGAFAVRLLAWKWLSALYPGGQLSGKIGFYGSLCGIILLLPAYFYAAGRVWLSLTLPAELGLAAEHLCTGLARITLLWSLARYLFSDPVASRAFPELPADTADAIRRFLKTLALLNLVLILLPGVLEKPPYGMESFILVAHTLYGIVILVPVYILLRTNGPLGRLIRHNLAGTFVGRNWGGLAISLMVVLTATAVMGTLGYHYGAYRISSRTLWSLFIGLFMIGMHQRLIGVIRMRAICTEKPECTEAEQEDPGKEIQDFQKRCLQIQRLATLSCIILTAFLIAVTWRINQQVLKSLDNITLYSMTSGGGILPVTLADMAMALLTLAVMTVLLKHLPGIYDVVLFQRTTLDAGLQYAMLNITRYGLFFLGVVIALSYINLDLGRITWLMAAVGFGLGFGMQEIFSNFVSGLILLVERPVRVGDIVRVGEVIGRVSRINIRATTVTDFDRLEVVIPNKDFITRDVTNWTLGDRIIRLIVPIGVAYGTDPALAEEILMEIAVNEAEVLSDPEPAVLFLEHGDSSLNFELRCYLDDPDNLLKLKSKLNHQINRALKERGIEIPFPQRDIHIRSLPEKNASTSPSGEPEFAG